MNNRFISVLKNFTPLLAFEPNMKVGQAKYGKSKFKCMLASNPTDFEDFYTQLQDYLIFSQALLITYISVSIIDELSRPVLPSTKTMQNFKSKFDYLNPYINGFKQTLELYENLERDQEAEELKVIINIFEKVKDKKTRKATLQKLIFEYLSDLLVDRDMHKMLMSAFFQEESHPKVESKYRERDNLVRLYKNYFDGIDVSIEDVERSLLIKLFYLYELSGTNKGRGQANPNKVIESIMLALTGKKMIINRSKMKNIYIKGFYIESAIFDYKSKTMQQDAIDLYFQTNVVPFFSYMPQFQDLICERRNLLLQELLLL